MRAIAGFATGATFVAGRSSRYATLGLQDVQQGVPPPGAFAEEKLLPCWEDDTADGVRMKSTESDATVAIFVVGRSSTCGQGATELLSEEAGAIGGVQMRAIAGFATGATFVAGRSSR